MNEHARNESITIAIIITFLIWVFSFVLYFGVIENKSMLFVFGVTLINWWLWLAIGYLLYLIVRWIKTVNEKINKIQK